MNSLPTFYGCRRDNPCLDSGRDPSSRRAVVATICRDLASYFDDLVYICRDPCLSASSNGVANLTDAGRRPGALKFIFF